MTEIIKESIKNNDYKNLKYFKEKIFDIIKNEQNQELKENLIEIVVILMEELVFGIY